MKKTLLQTILNHYGYRKTVSLDKRTEFKAARMSRLESDWVFNPITMNLAIRKDLRLIRQRSRDLEINNDIVKKFLSMFVSNVVGEAGYTMQAQIKNKDGTPNEAVNEILEDGFQEWGLPENCLTTGKMSFHQFCCVAARTWARDGGVLVRLVPGFGDYGFALQPIEIDALDEQLNMKLDNGNQIILGIEFDQYDRPVNYYLRTKDATTGEWLEFVGPSGHVIIPADQMIHFFLPYRWSQKREFPLMHSAMLRLNQLEGYEEAHLINARVAASKGIWFEKPAKDAGGDDAAEVGFGEVDEKGKPIMPMEPGQAGELPMGWKIAQWNPEFPQAQFPEFVKATLRGIASGLDVDYVGLANNLEAVNFSSIRAGLLEVRENWKLLQKIFVSGFIRPIFLAWLKYAMLKKLKGLKFSQMDEYKNVHFRGRRWPWVDPLKDIQAKIAELSIGTTTREAICDEKGEDWEEILEQYSRELEALKAKNIPMGVPTVTGELPQGPGGEAEVAPSGDQGGTASTAADKNKA